MTKRRKFLQRMKLGHIPMDVMADKSAEQNRKRIGNEFRLTQTQTFKMNRIVE